MEEQSVSIVFVIEATAIAAGQVLYILVVYSLTVDTPDSKCRTVVALRLCRVCNLLEILTQVSDLSIYV